MALFLLVVMTCWLFSKGQSPTLTYQTARPRTERQNRFFLPSNCSAIFNQGTTQPYSNTSMAAIFQTFCSVRQRFSQCVADHQQKMITGNNSFQWSVGVMFNKRVFDADSTDLCNRIPELANDMECLKLTGSSNESSYCAFLIHKQIPPVYERFRNGTITLDVAKKLVCSAVKNTTDCWAPMTLEAVCSKGVSQFSVDYFGIFYSMCASGSIIEALPDEIKDSAFVTCFIDSFTELVEEVIRKKLGMDDLIPFISRLMQHVCQKTEELSVCFVQRSRNTTNLIDRITLKFVNVSNIKNALDLLCSSRQAFLIGGHCLTDVVPQGQFCGKVYFGSLFKRNRTRTSAMVTPTTTTTPRIPTTPSLDTYVNAFCPPMKQNVDCTYLPLSRCHKNLTTTVDSVVNMLMTDRCRTLADRGVPSTNIDPTASTLIKCGNVIQILFTKELMGLSGVTSIGATLLAMIHKGLDVACRHADWYLSCVDQRLSSSQNVLDIFLREIIDFGPSVNRTGVINGVCQNLQDIKSNLGCLMNSWRYTNRSMSECLQSEYEWNLLKNITTLTVLGGDVIRSTFCGPIQKLVGCARTAFGQCSRTIASMIDNIPRAILRTDCGGVRPATTAKTVTGNSGNIRGRNLACSIKENPRKLTAVMVLLYFCSKLLYLL